MEKEKMVSVYDPIVNAYRQVPLSIAKKVVENVGELKKRIAEAEAK